PTAPQQCKPVTIPAAMQTCNHAALLPCSPVTMQPCNHAPCYRPCNRAALPPCSPVTIQPCYHAALLPYSPVTMHPVTMQPCHHAALLPCSPVTVQPCNRAPCYHAALLPCSPRVHVPQKYLAKYKEQWPCLQPSKNPHHAFCTVCNCDVDISHQGAAGNI
uniref:Uncharacterized protein n=1 Tax=Acanthochromis polyacanthus TaxID=80966 RepID=A0A3Q1FLD6_9TELE